MNLNPFEDNVVFEPREASRSVPGLNDQPLAAIVRQFERLEAEPYPRRYPVNLKAQLVTSPEPGYGKSHMIGRLFRELKGRATEIYLRPFQDPGTSWTSILLKVVQELSRPDDPLVSMRRSVRPTQLDAFACGVVGRLLADLIEKEVVGGDYARELAGELRNDPLAAFGNGSPDHFLFPWMREQFTRFLPLFVEQLRASDIFLSAPPAAWLKVLHNYCFGDGGREQRDACVEWLKGGGLSDTEAALAGLNERELQPPGESVARRNADAFARLQDLLALAGFFRPFLFCIDQIELFTGNPDLVSEFGSVVDELVTFGLNHMLVVTANVEPWTGVVLKTFQRAYQDRFSDPIQLEGIQQPQAHLLARQRIAGCGLPEAEVNRFCDEQWLAEIFRAKKADSVRSFLRNCGQRYASLFGARSSALPARTLEDCYRECEREVRVRPGRLDFDPNILMWSVGHDAVENALPGVHVKLKDRRQVYPICWRTSSNSVVLGFEDSSHALRWEAILAEAERQVHQSEKEQIPLRVVFLRTPEQPEIPGPGWKIIGPEFDAARDYFSVHVIGNEDLVSICASYELYARVVEGNAPFGRDSMLAFVRGKLKPWWQRLLVDPAGSVATPSVLHDAANANPILMASPSAA